MINKFFLGKRSIVATFIALYGLSGQVMAKAVKEVSKLNDAEALGKSLFFDENLSQNRTQSCASCHSPYSGFADPRSTDEMDKMVSAGDDGKSFGVRNAPTAAYAQFSPAFHKRTDGVYVGGQFLDGRETDLKGQAGGPPLNPVEMGMKSKGAVIARLKENKTYVASFKKLYGVAIFKNSDKAYLAMTKAIASFEKTKEFNSFDSKYDRSLNGGYKFTAQEELGRQLFFSPKQTNCSSCHQLNKSKGAKEETFSNYEYHNIGVPANPKIVSMKGGKFIDHGLLENPAVKDSAQDGKFKVPTLRNVAVTGAYMHNGVFKDLRTVILFHNKYNAQSKKNQLNPETGKKWAKPEVTANISLKILKVGSALDDKRINALVAFLKTLTDKRYESMLVDDE